jgi:membrane-bound lytic murein transglycosylase A
VRHSGPPNGCSPLLDGRRLVAFLLTCCAAAACAASPDAAARARRVSEPVARAPATTPGAGPWSDDGDPGALRRATDEALAALQRRAASGAASAETRRLARGLTLLREALDQPADAFAAALAARFVAQAEQGAFVTGYHEPLLDARRTRDARFRYALYRMPQDGRALPSRAAIEGGALDGRGLELFWTDDPVELFFLHVQGSGRLRLEDGTVLRVGYAGNNGQTYRAIGAVLVRRGVFRRDEATAPAIKAYLRAHPDDAPAIMQLNPRYVFFKVHAGPADDGPLGALGVPLVAYRSIAVDAKVVPLGSIGHLTVALPGGDTFSALIIAMDTGTAIAGPGRIDLFCGPGERAARIAGELRNQGELVWLTPRS